MRNPAVLVGSAATIILVVLSAVILGGQTAPARGGRAVPASLDMVKVCGKNCTVLLDNKRVRVTEVVLQPGETLGMHTHADDDIWFPKDDGLVRSNPQRGQPKDTKVVANKFYYSPAETHSVQNIGKTEYRSIVIELKKQ
jgi:hypothetical protein